VTDGAAPTVIGIDFDNTLVTYDAIFRALALEAGLIGPEVPMNKRAIRDDVRRTWGDLAWQALQGKAYGPRLAEAEPAAGARAFVDRCRAAGIPVLVISHKTAYATVDPSATPLRQAALDWLAAHGFMPLPVRFGATREEKLGHIRAAGCTHFIDDLEETFREPGFPSQVQGILYAPAGAAVQDLPVVRSWAEIMARFFHD